MPSLYTQYRPKNFSNLLGQDNITTLLRAELIEEKTAQSYIFIGPRGTGKTTTARILAKALNCENLQPDGSPCDECPSCKAFMAGKFLDMIEIDAASNRGIDEIREMKEKIEFRPTQGKRKIYVIDEVHMLTKEAFNALLKTLEEPPEHVTFILATTEPHKIPLTILSRCEKFEFKLGGEQNITDVLKNVLDDNNISIEDTALKRLIQFSGGSYRDALSLLDTIITSSGKEKKITFDKVQVALGLPDDELVSGYINALSSADGTKALESLEQVFSTGVHVTQFLKAVISEMREYLVTGNMTIPGLNMFSRQQIVKAISFLLDAYSGQKQTFDQRLPMQLATMNIVGLLQTTETSVAPVAMQAPAIQFKKEPVKAEEPKEKPVLRESVVEVQPVVSVSPAAPEVAENVTETPVAKPAKKLKKKKKLKAKVEEQPVAEEKIVEDKLVFTELTLDDVLGSWHAFLKKVQAQHNQLYAMFVTTAPIAVHKDEILKTFKLELGVKYDFHKKRIESPVCKEVLNTISQQVYGTPMQIVCTVNKEIVLPLITNRSPSSSTGVSEGTAQIPSEKPKEESLADAFEDIMGNEVDFA